MRWCAAQGVASFALFCSCCATSDAQNIQPGTTEGHSGPTNSRSGPETTVAGQEPKSASPPGTNSTTTLPTVTVTADPDKSPDEIAPSLGAVAYTIGSSQIQAMGQGENASFQEILLQEPGVVQDEFGEVHVRGDHGNVQYRLNGVSLPEGLNGFAQAVDPHLIHSVTLLTGTLPAQYGDRIAGIFDITTKSGSQLNGNDVSVYGGSYDTIHPSGSFGGTKSNIDYFITASYLHNNLGIDNTTADRNPLHDLTDQEKLFGYFADRFDKTSRATLLLSASYSDFQIPNTPGLTPSYTLNGGPTANSSIINENQNEQNYYAVLSYQKFARNFSGQMSVFSRYLDLDFSPDEVRDLLFNGNASKVKNTDLANGVQADGDYTLGEHHTLRGGFVATFDAEQLENTASVFPSASQFAPSGMGQDEPTPTPQSSSTPETINARGRNSGIKSGVYLQGQWQLTDRLTLNYGLRYDRFDVQSDHEGQVSPRANLVWQMDEATTAHIGYARYFQTPTLQYIPPSVVKQFEYTTDAPFNGQDGPQKCERDNYYDAGISRQITPAWQVTLDGYYKQARNLIDDGQFGTAVILDNFNYAKARVYGAELSSIYKHGPLSLYGNFSYVQAEASDINSVQNEFPDNEFNYIANNYIQLDHQGQFTGSGGLSYTLLTDTLLHTDFLYGDGLRRGFANLGKNPSYVTVNLGVEHVWRPHLAGISELKLRFDCLNLFDEIVKLRDGSGLGVAAPAYGPRRAFYGGLTAFF